MNDINLIFQILLITWFLQIIGFAFVWHLFPFLADKGWSSIKVVMTFGLSGIIWWLGYVSGLPVNSNIFLSFLILLSLGSSFYLYKKINQKELLDWVAKNKWILIWEEFLFLAGFLFQLWVRSHNPNILDLEKMMDFGFINRYLTSGTLPVVDMWFANGYINYYSFGHFWASIVIRIFAIPATTGYNVMLAFVLGTSMSLAFSIIYHLISWTNTLSAKFSSIKTGIASTIGAFLLTLGGNTHLFWWAINQYYQNKTINFDSYWYPDATRFIPVTIHEFPAYSFIVSDLHGHVLSLPLVLFFILMLGSWIMTFGENCTFKKYQLSLTVILGIVFGMMTMTNTWDIIVYGLGMVIIGLILLVSSPRNLQDLFKNALLMASTAAAIAIPWLMVFEPISKGVRIVITQAQFEKLSPFWKEALKNVWGISDRSELWQLAALWSVHVFFAFIGLAILFFVYRKIKSREDTSKLIILGLITLGIVLLILPEFIFFKDIYETQPRANSMFKLTYQGFIILSLIIGWVFGQIIHEVGILKQWKIGIPAFCLLIAIIAPSAYYPYLGFPKYYNFQEPWNLDGQAWLYRDQPDTTPIIEKLKDNYDGKNLIEASGDSYTTFNAIPVFSGVPTILGWKVHEWLWRGTYDVVGTRDTEIRTFYESGDVTKMKEIVKKYNIGWIVVGPNENKNYKVNLEAIKSISTGIVMTPTITLYQYQIK